jgi:hypothetical protein
MVAAIVLASASSALRVAAQDATSLLDARLDPTIRTQVERVIGKARADSLPVGPLVNKALEGTSKGAPPPRVLAAVQALAGHLGAARRALGVGVTEPEIVIGAEALRAGARPETLHGLRAAAGARPLTVPLTVLSALVGRGVPVDTAVAVVTALARRHVGDRDFLDLQHAVERDIGAGMPPGAAASIRATAGPPANVPARDGRPGRPPSRPSSRPPSRPSSRPPSRP